MKLALTGGTGFIGSVFRAKAEEQGWSVVLLSRTTNLVLRSNETECFWDASSASDVPVMQGVDALVNLAAFIPPNFADSTYSSKCLQVNAMAVQALIQACERDRVGRLIHFSSGNLYSPSSGLVAEDAPTYPAHRATYYLASKLVGEIFVEHARLSDRLDATVLRVSSVYGPLMPNAGLIPTFADRLLRGEQIIVEHGGGYGVDLVAVDDVVEAAILAIGSEESGVFNIGEGRMSTVGQVAEYLREATGASPEQVAIEGSKPDLIALGFPGLDVSRARRLLGYRPTSLLKGLRAYVDYLRSVSSSS